MTEIQKDGLCKSTAIFLALSFSELLAGRKLSQSKQSMFAIVYYLLLTSLRSQPIAEEYGIDSALISMSLAGVARSTSSLGGGTVRRRTRCSRGSTPAARARRVRSRGTPWYANTARNRCARLRSAGAEPASPGAGAPPSRPVSGPASGPPSRPCRSTAGVLRGDPRAAFPEAAAALHDQRLAWRGALVRQAVPDRLHCLLEALPPPRADRVVLRLPLGAPQVQLGLGPLLPQPPSVDLVPVAAAALQVRRPFGPLLQARQRAGLGDVARQAGSGCAAGSRRRPAPATGSRCAAAANARAAGPPAAARRSGRSSGRRTRSSGRAPAAPAPGGTAPLPGRRAADAVELVERQRRAAAQPGVRCALAGGMDPLRHEQGGRDAGVARGQALLAQGGLEAQRAQGGEG